MNSVIVWSGPVVTCTVCALPCIPTQAGSMGWRMPQHGARGLPDQGVPPCPGSGAAVELPEHDTTKRLREQQQQHIPEAKGLTDDENPMEGPSA